MTSVPPRPDVMSQPRGRLPLGAFVLVAAGALAIVAPAAPWWHVTASVSHASGGGGSADLGGFSGAAWWPGWVVATAGAGILACGAGALGTPARKTRRVLGVTAAALACCIAVIVLVAAPSGSSLVRGRADRAITAERLDGADTVGAVAGRLGSSAGLTSSSVTFDVAPSLGLLVAAAAAATALVGGWLLFSGSRSMSSSHP